MNEMLIAGTAVTLGDLVLLVEQQQDQISPLQEQLAGQTLQTTTMRAGAGGAG